VPRPRPGLAGGAAEMRADRPGPDSGPNAPRIS
jgi:hypothetical protein